jgi:hypothetical protein
MSFRLYFKTKRKAALNVHQKGIDLIGVFRQKGRNVAISRSHRNSERFSLHTFSDSSLSDEDQLSL